MEEAITFADVLIRPKFSAIESRKDVDLSFTGDCVSHVTIPIISANMDTVTESGLAKAMLSCGAQACLHRFQSIEDNVRMFFDSFCKTDDLNLSPMVSIGIGKKELERAEALAYAGAFSIVVDVANGASMAVVNQVKELRKLFGSSIAITVGNFATADSVKTFLEYAGNSIQGLKIGVGSGAICKTRVVTGVGYPQFSAIREISQTLKNTGITIISDGGLTTSGDCAKALGAGAHLLMSGSLVAGTDETPGVIVWKDYIGQFVGEDIVFPRKTLLDGTFVLDKSVEIDHPAYKKYRGSASKESYEIQGKVASHRAAEGETIYVPYKGPVKNVLEELSGGLRSAFTYTNSRNLKEFHKNVEFVRVSNNTLIENGIRGEKC